MRANVICNFPPIASMPVLRGLNPIEYLSRMNSEVDKGRNLEEQSSFMRPWLERLPLISEQSIRYKGERIRRVALNSSSISSYSLLMARETDPLLGHSSSRNGDAHLSSSSESSRWSRLKSHLSESVDADRCGPVLAMQCFIAGAADAAVYSHTNTWAAFMVSP